MRQININVPWWVILLMVFAVGYVFGYASACA
jgi:hypothetical protein